MSNDYFLDEKKPEKNSPEPFIILVDTSVHIHLHSRQMKKCQMSPLVGATTFSIKTLSVMTFGIMTLSKIGLFATLSIMTLSIDEIQHNDI